MRILSFFIINLCLFMGFGEGQALAQQADHFKGVYGLINEHGRAPEPDRKIVICDVDTVFNLWGRYAKDPFPADLEKVRNEPAIILGFSFRSGLFFNLEKNALIGANMLAMPGAKTDTMQLTKKSDSSYELGVRINNVLTYYNLGPREPLRRSRKSLLPSLSID